MTIYLEGNAIAPGKVATSLQAMHDQVDDPYYDARYTLRFNDNDHLVDAHGIVNDRGRFYGEHWIIVNYWYASLDGTATDAYDSLERTVSVFKCEPWEAQTVNGTKTLVIGVYLSEDGFLGWYYTEDPNATEDSFAAEIMATDDESDMYDPSPDHLHDPWYEPSDI
jgi:hypothetical protein